MTVLSLLKKSLSTAHLDDNTKCAVALSGGGDSLALLHLLVEALGAERIYALHFNHRLRPESDQEAVWVEDVCNQLGVACTVGAWQHDNDKPLKNIQAHARKARYAFLLSQMEALSLSTLMLGHTCDDVAETFLERLSRGSGLKGLAVLPLIRTTGQFTFIRPLRDCMRIELRAYLAEKKYTWLDDPSNNNPAFKRIRWREHVQTYPDLFDTQTIAATVNALSDADNLLDELAADWQARAVKNVFAGVYTLPHNYAELRDELKIRVFTQLYTTLVPMADRPRTPKILSAISDVAQQKHIQLGAVDLYQTDECLYMAAGCFDGTRYLSWDTEKTEDLRCVRASSLPAKVRQRLFKGVDVPQSIRMRMPFWLDKKDAVKVALGGCGLELPTTCKEIDAKWRPNALHFLAT